MDTSDSVSFFYWDWTFDYLNRGNICLNRNGAVNIKGKIQIGCSRYSFNTCIIFYNNCITTSDISWLF